MAALAYIGFTVLLTCSVWMRFDLPVLTGSILAGGAGERISLRLLTPVLLVGGLAAASLIPFPGMVRAGELLTGPAPSAWLPIGIAVLLSTLIVSQFSRFTAVPCAFIAALAGLSLAQGHPVGRHALPYLLSWGTAPLLVALLAALTYRIQAALLPKRALHMAILDARLLSLSTGASVLLLAAAGLNNAPLAALLPVRGLGNGPVAAALAAGCPLLLLPPLLRIIRHDTWNIADNELDTDPSSILALLAAMTIVLGLWATSLPERIGLAAGPLPVGTLYIAALGGISLTRHRALTDGPELGKAAVALVLSPVLALLFAYTLGLVLDGSLRNTAILLALALLIAGVVLYMRRQNRRILDRQILLAREQQVQATRKSLSALEVKSEMTEKVLLDQLEAKRKELVDFAMGISNQKEYMEDFYAGLKAVRNLPDGAEKDSRTDTLLHSLHQRMYFTREMNDFYARSEVLNKDFNQRLGKRFPNLTENEKKLANLLRQGFSSKYIASLMNIAPKSVEINRYRLRSKLGLDRGDNLIQFIKSI